MELLLHKTFLSIGGTLVIGIAVAQSAANGPVPFKEIQRKQFSDNYTGRELKKKELEIAPSKIVFLNTGYRSPLQEKKYTHRKKTRR